MYKVKKFKTSETVVDAKGDKHVIYVYGELTKTNHLDGVATVKVKYVAGDSRIVEFLDKPVITNTKDSFSSVKSFNFGWAICDPRDEFNEETAIAICKKRFGRTPLTTQEGKFLTDDMIKAILVNEIEYIKNEKLFPILNSDKEVKAEKYESPKVEVKNNSEDKVRFKDGDILRLIWRNGKVSYAAYHSVDTEKKTVTFYWFVTSARDDSYSNVTFTAPFTVGVNEFEAVDKACRSDILDIEKLLENKFNKRWNWKSKRLELKDASKSRSILDYFC